MARRPRHSRFWRQHTPYTCGPAALGNFLLLWEPHAPGPSLTEEIHLWRESSSILCPGSHAASLALAAAHRGLRPIIYESGRRPFLADHVRRDHPRVDAVTYLVVDRVLREDARREGIPTFRGPGPPDVGEDGGAGLLLMDSAHVGHREIAPHWVGLLTREGGGTILFDPLRRRALPSSRSLRDWWEVSGYAGSRCWIGLRPPSRSRPQVVPAGHSSSGNRTGSPSRGWVASG